MKKILLIACCVALACASCSSSKKASKSQVPAGMTEEVIPLSGPQYRSDAEYYRAVQNGVSPERSMAQKIAMQNARQELAAAVKADLAQVTENYARSQQMEANKSYQSQMTEMAYTVVDQQLANVGVVAEKLYRESDGSFRYYVCLEMSKAALAEQLTGALSNMQSADLEFDKEQFGKIFKEQLARVAAK